jgi:hypothetical protein
MGVMEGGRLMGGPVLAAGAWDEERPIYYLST